MVYRPDKSEGPTAGAETIDPLEFLARVLTHLPDKGQVMTGTTAGTPIGRAVGNNYVLSVVLRSGPRCNHCPVCRSLRRAESGHGVYPCSGPPDGSGARPAGSDRVGRGGHVIALGPAGQVRVPTGATIVNGRGKFLMPGLADMHMHLNTDEASLATTDGLERLVAR